MILFVGARVKYFDKTNPTSNCNGKEGYINNLGSDSLNAPGWIVKFDFFSYERFCYEENLILIVLQAVNSAATGSGPQPQQAYTAPSSAPYVAVFNAGDRVRNIATGEYGTIKNRRKSDSLTTGLPVWVVDWDYQPSSNPDCESNELELISFDTSSTIGSSRSGLSGGLSLPQTKINYASDIFQGVTLVRVPECDCGGFKTYNTMSPESHSSWCKSRAKV